MTKFVKWNDLNQFHEVVRSLGHARLHAVLKANDYKITYGTKIKIHGTNAGVRIESDGRVIPQKRSSDIVGTAENAGFRAWVEANENFFTHLAHSEKTMVIFGEWAGPGVQANVACSMTPNKIFYPFSIDYYDQQEFLYRTYDPEMIEAELNQAKALFPNDIIVLPWHHKFTIDFEAKTETEKAIWQLNALVEKIGERDPFFWELFEIDGCGEGLVCYPFLGAESGRMYAADEIELFSHFNFKAKSEAHRVNKTKAAVNFDPERFANKNRFADSFCTEQRMEQGFRDFKEDGIRDMKDTGNFIKWVCQDVFKESETEREASTVDWKDLSKVVSGRAGVWFRDKVSSI